MKKLILLLIFLVACAPVVPLETPTLKPTQTPEIIYVVVTATPEPTPEIQSTNCEYYFNTWENYKEIGATGLSFKLNENEALIFILSESAGLHEVGHFVDFSSGRISDTPEFKTAVESYLESTPEDAELYALILRYENSLDEVFASLYSYNLIGDYPLPKIFEEFFYVR